MDSVNQWRQQERTDKQRFKPKWTPKTIEWIISKLTAGIDPVDIQSRLAKDYGIKYVSTYLWVQIAERVRYSIESGYTLEEALEIDRNFRNRQRRTQKKLDASHKSST